MKNSPLSQSNSLIPIIQKVATDIATKIVNDKLNQAQYKVPKVPDHHHNGVDSSAINQNDIVPGLRTGGSITFATDATTYTLGTNLNPSALSFMGLALHTSGGTNDIHAQIIGNAQLGGNYYLQPGTQPFTTDVGGIIEPVIQGCSSLVFDSTVNPPKATTFVSQSYIAYVEFPAGTIVASLLVTTYGNGKVNLLSSLASGWQIKGYFAIT